MLKVLINADDYAMSDGICRGILELLEHGNSSNTTVMMAASGAVERIAKWGISPLKGLAGVHLQLTDGEPLSRHEEAPTLVTSLGEYAPREELKSVTTEDVLTEWERQINLFMDIFGETPTHLDSHHGTHHLPNCTPAFFELASRYDLPVRGGSHELPTHIAWIRGSDIVVYDWTTSGSGGADLVRQIWEAARQVSTSDPVVEVVTHPGYNDSYLESVSGLNKKRQLDLSGLHELGDIMAGPGHNLRLTSYPSLA